MEKLTASRLMIVGCGDLGSRLGLQMHARGWQVYGLRRAIQALPEALLPVAADLNEPGCPASWPREPLDYLVFCATADRRDAASYRAIYVQGLARTLNWLDSCGQKPRRLLFVSSTAVYAQADGQWLTEDSPAEAQGFAGQLLREAEQLALQSNVPASVVRLAGLYGPGREWLLRQVRAGYQVPQEPPQYSNRIHIEDAASLLRTLLEADQQGQSLEACYLGVDDQPAALHEVIRWLGSELGLQQTEQLDWQRQVGSKRCSNARARRLGWVPRYPNYQEGYRALLAGQD